MIAVPLETWPCDNSEPVAHAESHALTALERLIWDRQELGRQISQKFEADGMVSAATMTEYVTVSQ
jgi:hypothetical protein